MIHAECKVRLNGAKRNKVSTYFDHPSHSYAPPPLLKPLATPLRTDTKDRSGFLWNVNNFEMLIGGRGTRYL